MSIPRGGCGRPQPIEVVIEKDEHPVVQPHRLPDPVTDQVAAVEHGDRGLGARHQPSIDRDEDLLVAVVGNARRGCRLASTPRLPVGASSRFGHDG
jgi:hypothetical protein